MGNNYLVIDVETPNGNNDSICAISLTPIEDNTIGNPLTYLVNPEAEFWDRNTHLGENRTEP